MLEKVNKYDIYTIVDSMSHEAANSLYKTFMTKFLEKISSKSSMVYLPEDMSDEKRLDSLNLYSNTIKKFAGEVINDINPIYEFENALKIKNPKDFTETICSTMAEYVNNDIDLKGNYVKHCVNEKATSGEDYESIMNFVNSQMTSTESFFSKSIFNELKQRIDGYCSMEADDIIKDIRDEVEQSVVKAEKKNYVFRKALETIEETKDAIEEKCGIVKEEDDEDKNNDNSSDNEKDKKYDNDDYSNNSYSDNKYSNDYSSDKDDQSSESYISLENAVQQGIELDESIFEIDGYSEAVKGDNTDQSMSVSGSLEDTEEDEDEGDEDTPKKSDVKVPDSEMLEDQDGNRLTEESFSRLIVPKSLNKFNRSPKIITKKLVQYMLTKKDLGRSLESGLQSRLDYVFDLTCKESMENGDQDAISAIRDKIYATRDNVEKCGDLRDSMLLDLHNIGFMNLNRLDSDNSFGEMVIKTIEGKGDSSTECLLIKNTLKKAGISKEITAGRNIQRNLELLGSVEELINEIVDTLDYDTKNDMNRKIKSLENLETKLDFSYIIDVDKLKKNLNQDKYQKDLELMDSSTNFVWTDDTNLFKLVMDKLHQDKYIKETTCDVDLEYVVKCALNGDKMTQSSFEKILTKLRSSEGYNKLKEGQQYNVGKTMLTSLVAANRLNLLTNENRYKFYSY